jgi:hypothetical protein
LGSPLLRIGPSKQHATIKCGLAQGDTISPLHINLLPPIHKGRDRDLASRSLPRPLVVNNELPNPSFENPVMAPGERDHKPKVSRFPGLIHAGLNDHMLIKGKDDTRSLFFGTLL